MTIPFLALVAFLIITLMAVIALVNQEPAAEEDEEGNPLRAPWLRVSAPIATILIVFAVLFAVGQPNKTTAATPAFTVLEGTPGPQLPADPDSPAQLARGDRLYRESCVACHGVDAKGVANLGNPLVGTPFMAATGDLELLAAIRKGRDLSDPANTTGLVMPPSGGRPDLSDEDIMAIIAFLRAQE
jgi:mono/diheme cytochrome c family protein